MVATQCTLDKSTISVYSTKRYHLQSLYVWKAFDSHLLKLFMYFLFENIYKVVDTSLGLGD